MRVWGERIKAFGISVEKLTCSLMSGASKARARTKLQMEEAKEEQMLQKFLWLLRAAGAAGGCKTLLRNTRWLEEEVEEEKVRCDGEVKSEEVVKVCTHHLTPSRSRKVTSKIWEAPSIAFDFAPHSSVLTLRNLVQYTLLLFS